MTPHPPGCRLAHRLSQRPTASAISGALQSGADAPLFTPQRLWPPGGHHHCRPRRHCRPHSHASSGCGRPDISCVVADSTRAPRFQGDNCSDPQQLLSTSRRRSLFPIHPRAQMVVSPPMQHLRDGNATISPSCSSSMPYESPSQPWISSAAPPPLRGEAAHHHNPKSQQTRGERREKGRFMSMQGCE